MDLNLEANDIISKNGVDYTVGEAVTVSVQTPPPPVAGTLLRTFCRGTTKVGVFADGAGGETETELEFNCAECPVPEDITDFTATVEGDVVRARWRHPGGDYIRFEFGDNHPERTLPPPSGLERNGEDFTATFPASLFSPGDALCIGTSPYVGADGRNYPKGTPNSVTIG